MSLASISRESQKGLPNNTFDRTAGSIMNMFDFTQTSPKRKLFLNPNDGTLAK